MKSLDKQLNEAKKCILVCANCHRGIHANRIQIPLDYQSLFDEDQAKLLLDTNEEIKNGKKHYCIDCGRVVSHKATRCAECACKISRIAERPTREELKQLIRNNSFVEVGRLFKVSDNTIRKWCESENLPKKKAEIKNYSDAEWEEI